MKELIKQSIQYGLTLSCMTFVYWLAFHVIWPINFPAYLGWYYLDEFKKNPIYYYGIPKPWFLCLIVTGTIIIISFFAGVLIGIDILKKENKNGGTTWNG